MQPYNLGLRWQKSPEVGSPRISKRQAQAHNRPSVSYRDPGTNGYIFASVVMDEETWGLGSERGAAVDEQFVRLMTYHHHNMLCSRDEEMVAQSVTFPLCCGISLIASVFLPQMNLVFIEQIPSISSPVFRPPLLQRV